MFRRSLYLLAAVSYLSAQPTVFLRGIVNAGSSAPAGLPSGGIARGSLFTIYGSGIGPPTGVSATTYPVGTSLAGVTINIIQGSTQVSALPVYVSAGQVNALMPSNAPLGMASITVTQPPPPVSNPTITISIGVAGGSTTTLTCTWNGATNAYVCQ